MVEQGLVGKDVRGGGDRPGGQPGYLLKYDSTQAMGRQSAAPRPPDKAEDDMLIVNGQDIHVVSARTPGAALEGAGVDIVIESTGLHRRRQDQSPSRPAATSPRVPEGHHLRSGEERGHHRRHRRQCRQVRRLEASHHFQRQLHHELSAPLVHVLLKGFGMKAS